MKRLLCALLVLNAVTVAAAPKVLILDFNNQSKETSACASADPENVYMINDSNKGPQPFVDATTVGEMLDRMDDLAKNQNLEQSKESDACDNQVDTITISGHHGVNGNFFGGKNDRNGITAKQLREQLAKRPNMCKCLKNVILMGCYTGTVDAGETHWLKLCPNVNFTMGFPLQAPLGTHPRSAAILKKMCSPQTRAAAASVGNDKNALCEFYKNMPFLAKNGVSIANCYNLASTAYGDKMCYAFDDLRKMCAQFDPGAQMRAMYEAYYNAEPGYEMPPKDGADVEAEAGTGPIREYYNQLHLWYHCRQQKEGGPGIDMPSTATVIKLAKFTQIRNNINRLNRQEIAEYDATLRGVGLGQYALGDLEKKNASRAFIRNQILAAQEELRMRYDPRDPNMRALWVMNDGLDQTLVKLRTRGETPSGKAVSCTFFQLVHDGVTDPEAKSRCMVGYKEALKRAAEAQK